MASSFEIRNISIAENSSGKYRPPLKSPPCCAKWFEDQGIDRLSCRPIISNTENLNDAHTNNIPFLQPFNFNQTFYGLVDIWDGKLIPLLVAWTGGGEHNATTRITWRIRSGGVICTMARGCQSSLFRQWSIWLNWYRRLSIQQALAVGDKLETTYYIPSYANSQRSVPAWTFSCLPPDVSHPPKTTTTTDHRYRQDLRLLRLHHDFPGFFSWLPLVDCICFNY